MARKLQQRPSAGKAEGGREVSWRFLVFPVLGCLTVEAAREVFRKAPGLDLVDHPEKAEYPLHLDAAEKDNCQVGRLRRECAMDNGLCFWVSGDQPWKGAALNAMQIAEELRAH